MREDVPIFLFFFQSGKKSVRLHRLQEETEGIAFGFLRNAC